MKSSKEDGAGEQHAKERANEASSRDGRRQGGILLLFLHDRHGATDAPRHASGNERKSRRKGILERDRPRDKDTVEERRAEERGLRQKCH